MSEKYKHYYVSQGLVKNWSKDGKHASWYNPMTTKSIPNGCITRYFHSNLIDLPLPLKMTLDRLNLFFEIYVEYFLNENFSCLKSSDAMSAREVLIFQYLESPTRTPSLDLLIGRLSLNLDPYMQDRTKKGREEILRTEEIKRALNEIIVYAVDILDMEAVLVEAPVNRSFILGASPVTLINPYFSERKIKLNPEYQPFEVWGSVIVLPLTPEKALCLYDPETYTPEEDDILKLTEKDIDMLNSAMLYNSGDTGGVIHVCGEEYINELFDGLDDSDYFRDSFFGASFDEYPFPTRLSVLKVNKNAKNKIKARKNDPVRTYVNAIVDYDNIHLENMKGKINVEEYSKRLKEAVRILQEVKKENNTAE